MFNLLMLYAGWTGNQDSMNLTRIFEYTDKSVETYFRNGTEIAFDRLIQYPCLFMEEGTHNQLARIGTITRAQPVGADVIIDYVFDPSIPPIPNSVIYANRLNFHMPHDFEFTRGHWAVKNADLFRNLLRLDLTRRPQPKVFSLGDREAIEPKLASAMMPFEMQFNAVYDAIKTATAAAGMHCRRADEIWENPAIIQDIVHLIDRSRVVICDCSFRNPNVFYEIGLAHMLGREVILITQNDTDVPFDLRHLRYVKYLPNGEGLQALTMQLQARLTALVSG